MLHNGLLKLMVRPTCFGHYYAYHQERATMQMAPACGTSPWLWQVAGLVHGCRFKRPVRGTLHGPCTDCATSLCCAAAPHRTQYTHYRLKHILPQHTNNYKEVFLLIISTKTVTLARFLRMLPDDGPNGPKHVEAI
jgi:hypothetical protein